MLYTHYYFSGARAVEAHQYTVLPNPDHIDRDPKKVHHGLKIETAIRNPDQDLVQKIDIAVDAQDRVLTFVNTSVNRKGIPALVQNRPLVAKVKTQHVRVPTENINEKIPIQTILIAKNLLRRTV